MYSCMLSLKIRFCRLFIRFQNARGMGLGRKLFTTLKSKNKPILLEVEPVDYEDTDTAKRLKFYRAKNSHTPSRIGYNCRSLATGENTVLEILYWSPLMQEKKKFTTQ